MSLNRKVTYHKKQTTRIRLSFQGRVKSPLKIARQRGIRISSYIFNPHAPERGRESLVLLCQVNDAVF